MNRKYASILLAITIFVLLTPTTVWAQSDPSNFTNVFDYPGTPPLSDSSLPGSTQLNVLTGGLLTPDDFPSFPASALILGGNRELNVLGGQLSIDTTIGAGAVFNMVDGLIDIPSLSASTDTARLRGEGGEINISGGTVNNIVDIDGGVFREGVLNISGGVFNQRLEVASTTATISDGVFGQNLNLFDTTATISEGIFGQVRVRGVNPRALSISGGDFKEFTISQVGADVTIAGGRFGRLGMADGTTPKLIGGEFMLNGVALSTVGTINTSLLSPTDILSGTLLDGSTFLFSREGHDLIGSVDLVNSNLLPAADTTPMVFGGGTAAPLGLRSGQTLSVVGSNARMRDYFAVNGGTLTLFGGILGTSTQAGQGAEIEIITGTVLDDFRAHAGSKVTIRGGSFADGFASTPESDVQIFGGEFRLDGSALPSGVIGLEVGGGNVLTGTLQDGSVFIFSSSRDELRKATLTEVVDLAAADLTPRVLNNSNNPFAGGLRPGQTLTLRDGGSIRSLYAAVGATLNVEGGTVRDGLKIAQTELNLSGGQIGSGAAAFFGSTVNVTDGQVGTGFAAYDGSTVNVTGGQIDTGFVAYDGSTVNVSGGVVSSGLHANGGVININEGGVIDAGARATNAGTFNVQGGQVGENFQVGTGGVLNVTGGQFGDRLLINGEANLDGGTFGLETQLVNGVLNISDGEFGTPFNPGIVSEQAALVIGQTHTAGSGSAGGTVNISGGVFHAAGFSGPSVLINPAGDPGGASPLAVTITGGDFDNLFSVLGTTRHFVFTPQTMTGQFEDLPTEVADVTISGGTFGADFNAGVGSNVELLGGDFKIGGVAFAGGRVDSVPSGLVTGVLADGSPFIFSPVGPLDDRVRDVRLTEVALPAADLSPIVVDSLVGAPRGLRPGQQLTLLEGGRLERHFAVLGAQLTVNGGEIGRGLEIAAGGQVTISGGRSFGELQVHAGGTLNVTGGLVAADKPDGSILSASTLISTSGGLVNISGGEIDGFFSFGGSELNISGGKLGNRNDINNPDSIVNITGGEIERLDVREADVVNISGGRISHLGLDAIFGNATTYNISGGQIDLIGLNLSSNSNDPSRSTINFFGTEFLLDGEEIPGLTMGEVFTILDDSAGIRIVPFGSELIATLADGTAFNFKTQLGLTGDPSAVLNIVLVEPPLLTADFDGDGFVDGADLAQWQSDFGSNGESDSDGDEDSDGADFLAWQRQFGEGVPPVAGSSAVPEPAGVCLLIIALVFTPRLRLVTCYKP